MTRIVKWLEARHAMRTKRYLAASRGDRIRTGAEIKRQALLADHFRLLEDNEPERARLKLLEYIRTGA